MYEGGGLLKYFGPNFKFFFTNLSRSHCEDFYLPKVVGGYIRESGLVKGAQSEN